MNMRADGRSPATTGELDECEVRVVDAARVDAVRLAMPDPPVIEELASSVFAMLADPSRLRLLISLLEGGELCVCDLAATTGLSESATSHALRLLRAHRVVKVRRDGRMAYYSLDDSHVRLLLDLALEHLGHGE
ncbi:MAG: helix-turn-helix transcriptional regulator [Acidimicrobiia bacterium]|nr:helix-turn-helix transcriptional regulator [Acidimicrobiia bacterium]